MFSHKDKRIIITFICFLFFAWLFYQWNGMSDVQLSYVLHIQDKSIICSPRHIPLPARSKRLPDKLKIQNKWCNSLYIQKYNLCTKDFAYDFNEEKSTERKYYESTIKTELFDVTHVSDQKDNLIYIPNTNESITIVAAYIELIPFDRVGSKKVRDFNVYSKWASVLGYIANPLVLYTESEQFAKAIIEYRKNMISKTTIFLIKREHLYSFNYFNKICSIFFQPDYPVMQGITESPEYGCIMHSKSDFVADAVRRDIYNTPYYAWVDIGYFRDLVSEKKLFRLSLPKGFDDTKIALSKLDHDYILRYNTVQIFRQANRWAAGSMFLGKRDALLKFRSLYKRSVEYFLSLNQSSSDEITLTAIYSQEGRRFLKPEVDIQVFYDRKYTADRTFYLGHFCRTVL